MYYVMKTIYASELASAHMANSEYQIHEDTTLNEKFNILNVEVDEDILPTMEYYSIGLSPNIINGTIDLDAYRHSPINACLFYHVPFALKPIETDLSFTEQARYRLRAEVEIDGVMYAAYYLKKMGTSNVERSTLYVESQDGGMAVSTFNSTEMSPLSPKVQYKEDISSDNLNYVVSSTQVNISLGVDELTEIRNACKILYPDYSAIIGEIGFCSGVEGVKGERVEAGKVQLNFIAKTTINLDITDAEVDFIQARTFKIELGGMEPVVVSP